MLNSIIKGQLMITDDVASTVERVRTEVCKKYDDLHQKFKELSDRLITTAEILPTKRMLMREEFYAVESCNVMNLRRGKVIPSGEGKPNGFT
ncbi:unnamed protein product [Arabis nemorensis]|uniref:Uncharacterized protein n=1 Tax=Arabis nemorensis TaxID=586526 RepID=A0A565AV78_9BRAS|nr:unnamed protein product [Arabis nemorensis]